MTRILVDSNVLIDVVTNDPQWVQWSVMQLETIVDAKLAIINPLILAEVSAAFESVEEVDNAFPPQKLERVPLPWEAAFPAGQAFREYRRRGGIRTSPLPDFYIGAHAQVSGLKLLTRDVTRYRTYFPELELICPE